jgi:hypothetical protein
MEAERVLRGGEGDRASPVNGERFCRWFCLLHRLSADRGARSHHSRIARGVDFFLAQNALRSHPNATRRDMRELRDQH